MANNFSYQSNNGNSSDQVMYTSNRSRSESGSSDSSRGSGNSGKPRRRSHRPRGCRGGSNRRRQKNGEGGTRSSFKKTYNSDFKNRVHGKFLQPAANQSLNTVSSEEDSLTNSKRKNDDRCSFRLGSFDNNSGKDYNIILPDYGHVKSEVSAATVPDLQHGGNTYRQGPIYYNSYARTYAVDQENDYPFLQSSFSESSCETISEHRESYSQNQHEDDILPPPPSEELFDRPSQIPSGPNPYALSSSSGSILTKNQAYPTHTYAQNLAPDTVLPVSRPRPHLVESSPNMIPYLPGILQQVQNKVDYNYRAQRLEKQRQNVVGGSLFVTSPRSFLMSCKKSSFHE